MMRNLSVTILVMLLLGFAPQVDFAAHLGGLIVGTLIGLYYWGAHGITPLSRFPKLQFVLFSPLPCFSMAFHSPFFFHRKAFPFLMAGVLALFFLICILVLTLATTARPLFGENASS